MKKGSSDSWSEEYLQHM